MGLLSGVGSFLSQWKSSQNVRQQGANLTARAYADSMRGEVTEDVLAYRRMQENLEQVNRYRQDQLHQYNQATQWTSSNAARLKDKWAIDATAFGKDYKVDASALGAALNEYSNIDPVAGFIGNAIFGHATYQAGLKNGFNDENKALKIQRAMDSAVQEKFMRSTVKSGNEALEGINKQSEILAGELTDTAIDNTDKYYAAQSAIGDNGIEGSRNMSRNLDYVKSRDDAAAQLEYDMIRGQADSVGRGMAESFNQLVQQQEQATLSTLIAPVQFDMQGAMDASRQLYMNQPTAQDIDMAITGALPQGKFSVPGVNTNGMLNNLFAYPGSSGGRPKPLPVHSR
jgi:hypothetical protein